MVTQRFYGIGVRMLLQRTVNLLHLSGRRRQSPTFNSTTLSNFSSWTTTKSWTSTRSCTTTKSWTPTNSSNPFSALLSQSIESSSSIWTICLSNRSISSASTPILSVNNSSTLLSPIRLSHRLVGRFISSMANYKIYVTRPDIPTAGIDLLKKECSVSSWTEPRPVPRDVLLTNVRGKDALFCTLSDKIDKEVLDNAGEQLKCVATYSVGYEHIDLVECKKRGIRVGFTPDVLTDATAELTMAVLLSTNRRILEANKEVYNGGWSSWSPNWMCGQGLKGSQVGLFGFGRIGQEIAARLVPFKPAQLTYTTRNQRPEAAKKVGAFYVDFEEMLRCSDVIIVCCALTPETAEVFNKKAFDQMKSNCIFINTARGGVVHQPSLYEALKNKQIMAAGLDVTTPEPLPLDDPLLKLDNVVIVPHIGSADTNTRKEMSRMTALNILSALHNEKMVAEVTN